MNAIGAPAITPGDAAVTAAQRTSVRGRVNPASAGAAVIGHFNARAAASAPTADDGRRAAEEFISATLIEPILKMSRENNHAAPPFGLTPAEKSFGPMLDAEIARNIVARERYGLVDAVARQLRHDPRLSAEIDTHA